MLFLIHIYIVKSPYTIKVAVPSPLVVACSGTPVREGPIFEEDGWLSWEYKQSMPIPAYLIAIVAGGNYNLITNVFKNYLHSTSFFLLFLHSIIALKKAPIGPRSTVWTEKELLDACVHEFSQDTEKFIQAGEKITGIPYEWGAYDLVVLPGAFPYGGMENPQVRYKSFLNVVNSLHCSWRSWVAHCWLGIARWQTLSLMKLLTVGREILSLMLRGKISGWMKVSFGSPLIRA